MDPGFCWGEGRGGGCHLSTPPRYTLFACFCFPLSSPWQPHKPPHLPVETYPCCFACAISKLQNWVLLCELVLSQVAAAVSICNSKPISIVKLLCGNLAWQTCQNSQRVIATGNHHNLKNALTFSISVSHWCLQCVAHSFTASLIHSLTVLGAVPKSIAIRGSWKQKGKLIYPHLCSPFGLQIYG